MTTLTAELQRILDEEAAYPALNVEGLEKVLRALGWSNTPLAVGEVETALGALLGAGTVERVCDRGMVRYRAVKRPPAAATEQP